MKSIILILYLIIALNSRKVERLVRHKIIEPVLKRNNPDMDDLELLEKSDYITDIIFIAFNILVIVLILTGVL